MYEDNEHLFDHDDYTDYDDINEDYDDLEQRLDKLWDNEYLGITEDLF